MKPKNSQIDPLRLPSETIISFWQLIVSIFIASASTSRFPVATFRSLFALGGRPDDIWNWVAGPVVIFLISIILYAVEPSHIVRRCGGAVVLNIESDIYRRVERLAQAVAVRMPALQLAKVGAAQSAQAFGAIKNQILLGRGLVLVFRKSISIFDAIILHELGHLVHRDIGKGYAARAAVRAYLILTGFNVLVICVWFVSSLVSSPSCSSVGMSFEKCMGISLYRFIANALTFVPFLLVIQVSYATLLRYREFYADQVAVSNGARDALFRIFEQQNSAAKRFVWLAAFDFHPSHQGRLAALADSAQIFSNSKWLLLISGILIGAMAENAGTIAPLHFSQTADFLGREFEAIATHSWITLPPYAWASISVGPALVVGFLVLVQLGVRNGLTLAAKPSAAKGTFVELGVGYLFFGIGLILVGPLVANVGPWMSHGFPKSPFNYFLIDSLGDWLVTGFAIISSAAAGYLAAKIFHGSYRPRFALFFSYFSGWAALNITSMVRGSDEIFRSQGLSVGVGIAVIVVAYIITPFAAATAIDALLQRRQKRMAENGPANPGRLSHWLLRHE